MLRRREFFWPLIAVATLLEIVAAASFAAALFSDPLSRARTNYQPYGYTEVFGRVTSLDWSSDRGMLIAAIVLAAVGLGLYVAAGRSR
jgi:hypothetical protein